MCCEDQKIASAKVSVAKTIVASNVSQELLPASPWRTAIFIGQPDTGYLYLMPDATAVPGVGIRIHGDQAPLLLTIEDLGNIVQKQWFVIAAGTAPTILVIETLLPQGGPCG